MTSISLEALKEKTIGEVCELVKQAENLPEGFKFTYQKHKTQTAQELLDELNMEKKQ